jgi:hypothetical protein
MIHTSVVEHKNVIGYRVLKMCRRLEDLQEVDTEVVVEEEEGE